VTSGPECSTYGDEGAHLLGGRPKSGPGLKEPLRQRGMLVVVEHVKGSASVCGDPAPFAAKQGLEVQRPPNLSSRCSQRARNFSNCSWLVSGSVPPK
jgi:hypothetical protein